MATVPPLDLGVINHPSSLDLKPLDLGVILPPSRLDLRPLDPGVIIIPSPNLDLKPLDLGVIIPHSSLNLSRPLDQNKKRKQFSLEEKKKIIEDVESGLKKGVVARKYEISPSTLSTFLKDKEKIMRNIDCDGVGPKRKKIRTGGNEDVDKAVYKWFLDARLKNISLNGPMLCEQARFFAQLFGMNEFKGSTGWLHRFRERYAIRLKTLQGVEEINAVPTDLSTSCREEHLKNLVKNYSPNDIYNADETALFYKLMPNKTMALKGEKCEDGKYCEERLSVLMCTNSNGSDKVVPWIVGKYENPKCFKNTHYLPCEYRFNSKAWVTGDIFRDWLLSLERRMRIENRKILLLIDNCSAHKNIPRHIEHIKVVFLSPDSTSVSLPMDQGIIHKAKLHYKSRLIRRMLIDISLGCVTNVNVLDAMQMLCMAWKTVSVNLIINCFQIARIVPHDESNREIVVEYDNEIDTNWKYLCRKVKAKAELQEFIHIDDEVIAVQNCSEEEIVSEILKEKIEKFENVKQEDEEECHVEEIKVMTALEATKMMRQLRQFIMARKDITRNILDSTEVLQDFIEIELVKNVPKKKKVVDFFHK